MPAGTTAEHQGIFRRGTHNCCADAYVCRKCRSEPQSSTANCFRDTRRTIRVVTGFDPPSSAVPQRSRSPPRRTVSSESPVAACVISCVQLRCWATGCGQDTWVEVRRNGARMRVECSGTIDATNGYRLCANCDSDRFWAPVGHLPRGRFTDGGCLHARHDNGEVPGKLC